MASALCLVHTAVLQLSNSDVDLAKGDFILTSLIIKLEAFDFKIIETLHRNIIVRIVERRTILSDIYMYLTIDEKICEKSHFFSKPDARTLKSCLDFVEPFSLTETTQLEPETTLSVDQLIANAPKRSKEDLNDVDSFVNFGACSERIKAVISTLRSIRVTSIVFIYENRDN